MNAGTRADDVTDGAYGASATREAAGGREALDAAVGGMPPATGAFGAAGMVAAAACFCRPRPTDRLAGLVVDGRVAPSTAPVAAGSSGADEPRRLAAEKPMPQAEAAEVAEVAEVAEAVEAVEAPGATMAKLGVAARDESTVGAGAIMAVAVAAVAVVVGAGTVGTHLR